MTYILSKITFSMLCKQQCDRWAAVQLFCGVDPMLQCCTAESVYEQTSRELNFSEDELVKLISSMVNLRPGVPELDYRPPVHRLRLR
jgi:hypothetical protein